MSLEGPSLCASASAALQAPVAQGPGVAQMMMMLLRPSRLVLSLVIWIVLAEVILASHVARGRLKILVLGRLCSDVLVLAWQELLLAVDDGPW